MRHGHGYRKLNRSVAHRRALLRNMVTSLIKHERCETTVAKAKALRPVVEKYITLAKNDTLSARRRAYDYLFDKSVVKKLFEEIGPRYQDRDGGYTRIVRSRIRPGDSAEMAVIELVDSVKQPRRTKKSADGATGSEAKSESGEGEQTSTA
ncbi:MAG: 50S ribosomal protein L17 [Candidatus Dadabacteria bacterium]|nr:MAG: 50S ribosomal protein L17 [Candidatus Dadabacteria bacterium]